MNVDRQWQGGRRAEPTRDTSYKLLSCAGERDQHHCSHTGGLPGRAFLSCPASGLVGIFVLSKEAKRGQVSHQNRPLTSKSRTCRELNLNEHPITSPVAFNPPRTSPFQPQEAEAESQKTSSRRLPARPKAQQTQPQKNSRDQAPFSRRARLSGAAWLAIYHTGRWPTCHVVVYYALRNTASHLRCTTTVRPGAATQWIRAARPMRPVAPLPGVLPSVGVPGQIGTARGACVSVCRYGALYFRMRGRRGWGDPGPHRAWPATANPGRSYVDLPV